MQIPLHVNKNTQNSMIGLIRGSSMQQLWNSHPQIACILKCHLLGEAFPNFVN